MVAAPFPNVIEKCKEVQIVRSNQSHIAKESILNSSKTVQEKYPFGEFEKIIIVCIELEDFTIVN